MSGILEKQQENTTSTSSSSGSNTHQSFVETLLSASSQVSVRCQYDSPYNITENQCTWFSMLCAKERKALLATLRKDVLQFKELYEDILQRATSLRNEYGTLPQGENLDEINHEEFSTLIAESSLKCCQFGDMSILLYLPPEVRDMVLKRSEKITQSSFDQFETDIENLSFGGYVSVNADGKTLVAVCSGEKEVLLLDSHVRWSGIMSKSKFVDYVTNSRTGNYVILWMTSARR